MKASCTMASRLITMIQSGSLCAFWSIDECCKLYMEQFCPCQEWTGLCLAAREDCVTGCVPCWTLGSWATACLVMATWSAIQTEVFKKWMISILSHQIACWNTSHTFDPIPLHSISALWTPILSLDADKHALYSGRTPGSRLGHARFARPNCCPLECILVYLP